MSAAVSLKDVLNELAKDFESKNENSKILFNFGSSGALAQQIMQGAPADIFVSASGDQINALSQNGFIEPGAVRELARNSLLVAKATRMEIHAIQEIQSLSDLCKLERIAIGNPKTVPAGAYAKEALEKAGVYEKLNKDHKLVLAEDARQVLAYVEGGDVDAGIVYKSDLQISKDAKLCFEIPLSYARPIKYEIASLKECKNSALSREFIEFMTLPQSKKMFEKRGFSL